MYGSIAKVQVAPENRAKVESVLRDWERDLKPSARGAEQEYLFWPDDDGRTGYLLAMFGDETTYRQNADSPQQDAWYRRLRELLEADPEWMDGRFVAPTS